MQVVKIIHTSPALRAQMPNFQTSRLMQCETLAQLLSKLIVAHENTLPEGVMVSADESKGVAALQNVNDRSELFRAEMVDMRLEHPVSGERTQMECIGSVQGRNLYVHTLDSDPDCRRFTVCDIHDTDYGCSFTRSDAVRGALSEIVSSGFR